MSAAHKAVFLSYASQDAEAVKRICDALRAAGVEVWFDQSELTGGDAWDAKIRKQIKECALFVPVISANTNARREGYFRREWKIAVDRTHDMDEGLPFLLPIVIDATTDTGAFVPEKFREVQWTRLPGGETPPAFGARVQKLLSGSGMEAGRPRPAERGAGTASPVKRGPSKWWWALPMFGVAMALVLVLKEGRRIPVTAPAAVAPADVPLSEAGRLVAQARKIWEEGDELNRETYFLAEDLIKRAVTIEPSDGSAWALYAQISASMIWFAIDDSAPRRDAFRRQVGRARVLAPEAVDTRLAEADLRMQLLQDLPVAEKEALRLVADAPENWRVQRALGFTYRLLRRPEEAQRVLERACELSHYAPQPTCDLVNLLLKRNRYAEAEKLATAARAKSSIGRLLAYEVMFNTWWRGDLAAAGESLKSWPDWLLLEDRGAFLAWETAMWNRQPEKALGIALRVQRDYFHSSNFSGPRAVLTARAHELAGHPEAARTDWRSAMQAADRVLAESPDDASALHWKAWALARLGDQAGAQAIVTRMQQSNLPATAQLYQLMTIAPLYATVGLTDQALEDIRTRREDVVRGYALPRAALELDPCFDALRADPRFRELVKSAAAPEDKSADGLSVALAGDKSVAVLAFANLSDDKANEYFSDGISEELLNVLAKVPGLKVTARTSSFHFKGKDTSVPEIARQLGVAYVVEGSVRKSGDKVRITAQLIKAADGFHVWSDTFTRDLKDIFAVQDEIAGLISRNLEIKMGVLAVTQTVDPEAYRLYLEALPAITLRTAEGYDRAEQLLTRAVERDPRLVPAQAALAVVWIFRFQEKSENFSTDNPAARRIIAQAEMAVRLGPDWAEAQAACGLVYGLSLRFTESEKFLRRAVQINPSYAPAHLWLGRTLLNMARMDEALAELKHATELDPLSHRALDNYAFTLLDAGQPRAALGFVERALQLQADSAQALEVRAAVLARMGRLSEALAIVNAQRAESIGDLEYTIEVYAIAGRPAELEALLAASPPIRRADRFYALAALGRNEEALAELKSTPAEWGFMDLLLFGPLLDPMRRDPRFQAKLESIGAVESHARAQAWRKAHPPESVQTR